MSIHTSVFLPNIILTIDQRRTLLAILIQVMQQFTGVSFIFNYGTVFFSQVGVGGPFIIMIMTNLVNLIGTVVSFFLVDRLGRRPLLLVGSVIMFIGQLSVGVSGLKAEEGDMKAKKAIVAFVLIYVFGFAASWGPLYAPLPCITFHRFTNGINFIERGS